jgi:hypothetical protein
MIFPNRDAASTAVILVIYKISRRPVSKNQVSKILYIDACTEIKARRLKERIPSWTAC